MSNTFWYKASVVLLTLSLLGLGLVLYWSFAPYKVITFNNVPFPVKPSVIRAGETVVYKVDYCKYTDINPEVTRFLTDGVIYMLSSNPAVPKSAGCNTVDIQVEIPKTLLPDTYTMKIEYAYKVNPVRIIHINAETVPFEITK